MMKHKIHQKLPHSWEEREKLRENGQFWTPSWVAEAMVQYVISGSNLIFDPAAGKGAFCLAFKKILDSEKENNIKKRIKFYGIDIDNDILKKGEEEGIYQKDFCILELRDFIHNPPKRKFKSIVANPPYIRHHRIPVNTKNILKELSRRIMGFTIDGRAGLHIYFLILALSLLEPKGKLAFIMPADTCEGIFSKSLWGWITKNYRLKYVITFLPEATPFPNVDTNAIVFLIKNIKPTKKLLWVQSKYSYSDDLRVLIKSNNSKKLFPTLNVISRNLEEALKTGLSRPPAKENYSNYKLSDFAYVMRGIATGDNQFFFLTKEKAKKLNIPNRYFIPAIGRTKDIEPGKIVISDEDFYRLDRNGRPTLLLSLNEKNLKDCSKPIRYYIDYGEKIGINKKSLLQTRNPWYKMEKREVPEFLFTYLGRKKIRFIKNNTNAVPLTGFLCVYSRSKKIGFINKLWKILQHPLVGKNLRLVGKSYGSGAIKVEPRALESLPIPNHLVKKYGLDLDIITSRNIRDNK